MLSRESHIPLYHQIKEKLTLKIELGEFLTGVKLTPESEMVARYGTSRHIVREALKILECEGQVERVRGKGTFVRKTANRAANNVSGNFIAVLIPDMTIYVFAEILSCVEARIRE